MPLRNEDDSLEDKVSVVFDFPRVDGFDANWREFLIRKQVSKTGRKEEDETKDSVALMKMQVKKSARNPTPIEPIAEEEEAEQEEDEGSDPLKEDEEEETTEEVE